MTSPEEVRASQIEQGVLWDELRVDSTWFHIMRSFSHDKEIAKIGVMALAVYVVIKGHTEFRTGNAFPSIPVIAEQIGVSVDTVQLALKVLVKHGWLNVAKHGRNNLYSVVEKVNLTNQSLQTIGTAERKYAGLEFQGFIEEVKRLAKTGNLPTDRGITINLTLNVQNINQGDNGTVTQNVQNIKVNSEAEFRAAVRKF